MDPDNGTRPGPRERAAAANIRVLRTAQRLTTRELSARLEQRGHRIAQSSISKMEKGGKRISLDDLEALAGVFGVQEPWSLVTGVAVCQRCGNAPPAGFTCQTCGTAG